MVKIDIFRNGCLFIFSTAFSKKLKIICQQSLTKNKNINFEISNTNLKNKMLANFFNKIDEVGMLPLRFSTNLVDT